VADFCGFSGGDKALGFLADFFNGDWVFSEIFLEADEDDWYVWTSLVSFFNPLL
jgi:hypothetical protein